MTNTFRLLLLLLQAWAVPAQSGIHYDLQKPTKQYLLPDILREISGITYLDDKHIACVQDELGKVFVFDLELAEISHTYAFDTVGDFEAISYTGKDLYILRSDGRLTAWRDFAPYTAVAGKYTHKQLSLATYNNEGLCYDAANNRLLIAAKSRPQTKGEKAQRYVYAYHPGVDSLESKPVFSINMFSLFERFGIGLKYKQNKKGKKKLKSNFRPSCIAIHPLSQRIYILSAADYMLVEMDMCGEVLALHKLPKQFFPKAEGLTFMPDGTLLISNEGVEGKKGSLLIFKPEE